MGSQEINISFYRSFLTFLRASCPWATSAHAVEDSLRVARLVLSPAERRGKPHLQSSEGARISTLRAPQPGPFMRDFARNRKNNLMSVAYTWFSARLRMTTCLWRLSDSGGEISHPLGSPALPAGCVIGARRTSSRLSPLLPCQRSNHAS
jgi:hypothetical protein